MFNQQRAAENSFLCSPSVWDQFLHQLIDSASSQRTADGGRQQGATHTHYIHTHGHKHTLIHTQTNTNTGKPATDTISFIHNQTRRETHTHTHTARRRVLNMDEHM